jgi:hypothetical protein
LYTADGDLIYARRLGPGNVVVLNGGVAGPGFDDVVSPILTNDEGTHIAYVARRGDSFVEVRDQQAGPSFPGKRELSFVSWISMNEEGTHLAYSIVRGGKRFEQGHTRRALRRIVIDGTAGPEYDALNLVPGGFGKDTRHYFYAVRGAQGDRDRIVFDGLEGPLYDDVFTGPARFLDDEQTIEFFARQGGRFLRVTARLE